MRNRLHSDERGATALLVAVSLLFLMGSAALAVDVSGFYQDARFDQTTADLSCLAGAAELPDSAAAQTMASDFAKLNWPELGSATLTAVSATVSEITDGVSTVQFEAGYGGSPTKMRVTVTEQADAQFARAIGSGSVTVVQEAICESKPAAKGPGMLPMAALPGAFSGDLFDCAAKVTGNCGAIDSGSGASDWRAAIANGLDGEFQKHHGNWSTPDGGINGTECIAPYTTPCNAIKTEPGNMVGPFNQGVQMRLNEGGVFNTDTLAQILGGSPQTLAQAFPVSTYPTGPPSTFPSPLAAIQGWHSSLYGDWNAMKSQQYYWNGPIAKCDSPRLATVPIMNWKGGSGVPNHWNIGDSQGTWPNGRKTMKIIGFYSIYIREPDQASDVGNGNGNGLDQIVADVVWFGENATCNGVPVNFYGTANPLSGGIKLVDG